MSDFNAGDKVMLKRGDGSTYGIPEGIALTVKDAGKGWISLVEHRHGWYAGPYNPGCFTKWFGKPVRTVTRTEIIAGNYGAVEVSAVLGDRVGIRISHDGLGEPEVPMNSDELRAAASIFTEIADALDEGAK